MKRGWVAILAAILSVTSGCAWLKAAPGNELLKSNCEGREIEPVPVGVLLPLSGKYQWYGDAALSGIRLGVEGTDGLRLVVRDTEGDPQRAVRELEDLAAAGVTAWILSKQSEGSDQVWVSRSYGGGVQGQPPPRGADRHAPELSETVNAFQAEGIDVLEARSGSTNVCMALGCPKSSTLHFILINNKDLEMAQRLGFQASGTPKKGYLTLH